MNDMTGYDAQSTQPPARRGVSWRMMIAAATLTLAGGAAAGAWLAWSYLQEPAIIDANAGSPPPMAAVPTALIRPRPVSPVAAPPPAPLTPTQEATLATRLSLLEDRLSRISVAADGASGNAAKAEALLLALVARRAIDRGLPLGVLEAQLRLRFGETQPVAVEAIVNAARQPTTDADLVAGLAGLRTTLAAAPDAGLFDRLRAGIDSLIVIRPNDMPSPTADNRFGRAMAAIERGRIDLAVREVEAMPGARAPEATAWLRQARLRNDAMRALDLIESAALLAPGSDRVDAPPASPPPAAERRAR